MLLLSFTLTILVLPVLVVRALMIACNLPLPTDPIGMASPRGFRALMLGSARLPAPVVTPYLPSGSAWRPPAHVAGELWIRNRSCGAIVVRR